MGITGGYLSKVRDALLKELHESHSGISQMKSLARSHIWWPKMDADIELCVRNCMVWFGLVSLFNGISTFVGYLIPELFS